MALHLTSFNFTYTISEPTRLQGQLSSSYGFHSRVNLKKSVQHEYLPPTQELFSYIPLL